MTHALILLGVFLVPIVLLLLVAKVMKRFEGDDDDPGFWNEW